MNHNAPAWLTAIEGSGVGAAIRESVWIYPTANVAHILALAIFAGAVAVMDLRILGAFKATVPAGVILPARRAAVIALSGLLLTGSILFTAEASHVALNPVFQIKEALISLGLINAALIHVRLKAWLAAAPALTPVPAKFRISAALS